MNRQDNNGVRSAAELERKYKLWKFVPETKKAIKNSETGLNKTNALLDAFVISVAKSLSDMQDQLDGSITTHFYSGVPTLENMPASEWMTDEEKNRHLGDMYYDQETGYAYRFVVTDGVYGWIEIKDSAVAEALAIANAAQDTADSKRRVFLEQPVPPYDSGDLWLRDQELYRCQISKADTEVYEENDFIVATNYTSDTLAVKVGEELEILKGVVTTIKEGTDSFEIEIKEKISSIDELQQETVEQLKKTSYNFGTEDLVIEKSGSELKTHFSEDGMTIKKNGEDVLVANNKGVDAANLHATTYLIVGRNSRLEDFGANKDRTGCFWIGS